MACTPDVGFRLLKPPWLRQIAGWTAESAPGPTPCRRLLAATALATGTFAMIFTARFDVRGIARGLVRVRVGVRVRASLMLRPGGRFFAGPNQLLFQIGLCQAFEGAEVGPRQCAGLECPQQQGAFTLPLLLLGLLGLLGLLFFAFQAVGGFCFLLCSALRCPLLHPAGVDDGTAAGQLGGRGFQVFGSHFARRLPVQVETLGLTRQGQQIGRASGVAVQEA